MNLTEIFSINKPHRNTLFATSIITKVLVILITIFALGIYIDLSDFNLYLYAIQNILHGLYPWANDIMFYHPPLAYIPGLIAYPIYLLAGQKAFVVILWLEMMVCDIITTFCIYWVGLKLYKEHIAYLAAMLYATAFSTAYFVLFRIDAFSTCIVMLALVATLYSSKTQGYLGLIIGLFTKLWAIVLYPFFWIYNGNEKRTEAIVIAVTGIAAFGAMILSGFDKFLVYSGSVYVQTLPYLVYSFSNILGSTIEYLTSVWIFRILTILVIAYALFSAYRQPKNLRHIIVMILVSVFVIIFFSNYRSPQYIVWITPLLALLVAQDTWGIRAFYAVQTLTYIEFPVIYGTLYTNFEYISGWAPVFFVILFIGWCVLMWRALKPATG